MPEHDDPFRLRVQKALADALREITPDNGYKHDLSGADDSDDNKLFRGRAIFGDDDPVPMVSILEEPIAPETDLEPADGDGSSGAYNLMVQGFADDDKRHPTDPAHRLMADVKKRLAKVREESKAEDRVFQFGAKAPTVVGITFGGGVVRPPDEISAKAYFWLRVTLNLVEDHENPYA